MKLIADSGATKTTWCLAKKTTNNLYQTQGLSPYYFTSGQIEASLTAELLPQIGKAEVEEIYFYGTGCATPAMQKIVLTGLKKVFPGAGIIEVQSDLFGAARALCGEEKGIACILGTGSNSCVFNGKKITRNNPAPGFILGDEGSGAYLGKKVLQHFIYGTFDEELTHRFNLQFNIEYRTILDNVYKMPLPNRFMASFTTFLSENRGHYMIENILEDGLSDFIITHLYKYAETWTHPIHFCGSISWHFRDKLQELAAGFQIQIGRVLQAPIDGLIEFHKK
jgi:N-acetylglucosamine kinase-like BadF-type ATPase